MSALRGVRTTWQRRARASALAGACGAAFAALVLLALSVVGSLLSAAELGATTLLFALRALGGSIEIALLALAFSVPVGVLAGVFGSEVGGAAGRASRLATELLAGAPPIVIGVVVYAVIVEPISGFSATAGAIALGLLLAPTVARLTFDELRSSSSATRDAALALGVSRWRVVAFVLVRSIVPALVTGGSLALARALGEVAPLLYTTALGSHSAAVEGDFGLSLLPTEVFALAPSAGLGGHGAASTLALVLLCTVVLVAGLGRLAGRRLS